MALAATIRVGLDAMSVRPRTAERASPSVGVPPWTTVAAPATVGSAKATHALGGAEDESLAAGVDRLEK